MSKDDVISNVANHYLEMTPEDFDDWLQSMAPAGVELTDDQKVYSACQSAIMAGLIDETWARQYVTI